MTSTTPTVKPTPRIVITGASSYLASRLLPIASQYGQVIGTVCKHPLQSNYAHIDTLNITNERATLELIARWKPHAIIHAAAANPGHTDEQMYAVNHHGTANIAKAAEQQGCRLVMVSTDCVHAGNTAPYSDTASPTPISAYGDSKAQGEAAIQSILPTSAIVRTSLIYGTHQIDRGTAGFINRLNAGHTLELFSNVYRQPVWIDALANALCQLATTLTDTSGTLNVAGSDVLSRSEFAHKLLSFWQINADKHIIEVMADSNVPLDLRLELTKAATLGLDLNGVNEVLQQASQSQF